MRVKETRDRSIVVKESPDRGQRQKYRGKGGWIDSIWQLVDRFKYFERPSWSQRQWDAQTAAWLTRRGMVSVLLLINLCPGLDMLRHSVWSELCLRHAQYYIMSSFFFLSRWFDECVCVSTLSFLFLLNDSFAFPFIFLFFNYFSFSVLFKPHLL